MLSQYFSVNTDSLMLNLITGPICEPYCEQNFRVNCSYVAELSIERKRPIVIEHFLQPSVGLCVCLSVQCSVAKRLIGYGCGLGWYVITCVTVWLSHSVAGLKCLLQV